MKKITKLGMLITILAVITAVVTIGINATPTNTKDVDAIKKIIVKASTQAEKNYIEAKVNHQKGTLIQNKSALLEKGSKDMNDIFSDKMVQKLKKGWVDAQIENAETGSELIDSGITNIDINDISISGNTANVNATLTKYLIERINQDGKYYFDRMEGKVIYKVTLMNEDGKWKISDFESIPDLDAKHTLIEEK